MFIQYYLHDQKRGLVGGQTYFCARSARIYSLIHGDDDTLFRNKSFILDEIVLPNASKFPSSINLLFQMNVSILLMNNNNTCMILSN